MLMKLIWYQTGSLPTPIKIARIILKVGEVPIMMKKK